MNNHQRIKSKSKYSGEFFDMWLYLKHQWKCLWHSSQHQLECPALWVHSLHPISWLFSHRLSLQHSAFAAPITQLHQHQLHQHIITKYYANAWNCHSSDKHLSYLWLIYEINSIQVQVNCNIIINIIKLITRDRFKTQSLNTRQDPKLETPQNNLVKFKLQ